MSFERVVVVGAGAFGLSAARELTKRSFRPVIVDPTGPTPHSLAASRDISKIVRSEYGGDMTYTEMAQNSIEGWLNLNEQWGPVYHNTGITRLSSNLSKGSYEWRCLETASKAGLEIEKAGPLRPSGIGFPWLMQISCLKDSSTHAVGMWKPGKPLNTCAMT